MLRKSVSTKPKFQVGAVRFLFSKVYKFQRTFVLELNRYQATEGENLSGFVVKNASQFKIVNIIKLLIVYSVRGYSFFIFISDLCCLLLLLGEHSCIVFVCL